MDEYQKLMLWIFGQPGEVRSATITFHGPENGWTCNLEKAPLPITDGKPPVVDGERTMVDSIVKALEEGRVQVPA